MIKTKKSKNKNIAYYEGSINFLDTFSDARLITIQLEISVVTAKEGKGQFILVSASPMSKEKVVWEILRKNLDLAIVQISG